MELYIILLVAVVIGFIMGRMTVTKAEEPQPYKVINLPVPKPKERKLTKEEKKELEKYTTIMENVENYDGTGNGQKDVPL